MSTTQLLSPRPNGRTSFIFTVRAMLALTAGVLIGALLLQASASAALSTPASATLFRLQSPVINESSGLAFAGGVYWTHNDGPVSSFYALNSAGTTLGVFTVPKSLSPSGSDWEDMAAGKDGLGRPSLYFANIGDNARTRAEISVIRVARPVVDPAKAATTTPTAATNIVKYRFKYPDGPHDAESLLVQPGTNRIFIISKAYGGAVYAAPAQPSMSALNMLTKIGTVVIPGATAADFSADGTRLVVRQYKNAAIYTVTNRDVTAAIKTVPVQFNMPSQAQGESITFDTDNSTLIMTSEGINTPVLTQQSPT